MTLPGVAAFVRERIIFAKLAAIILWISYAISIILGDGRGTFNLLQEVIGADHLAWYTAARLVVDGHPEQMYNHEVMADYQNQLIPFGRWKTLMAYRNPPFYCLLYLPTCQLPFVASVTIWAAIYIILLWFSVKWLGGDRRAFLWVLSFYPFFTAISYGQNSLLSFAMLAGTYRLLQTDRVFAAGMVAGLLWFKPPLLLGLILWGLLDIRKLWPAAVGVIATGLILTAGSYIVIPTAWSAFMESLTGNVTYAAFEQWKMHNPLAFWRLLMPFAERWHWPLAAVCGVLATLGFVQLWRSTRHDLPTIFGGVILFTLWASPHALIYEWVILAITGILWWPRLAAFPDQRFLLYAATWLVFFVSTHAAERQLLLQGSSPAYDGHSALQLSVVVMAIVAVIAGRLLLRSAYNTMPGLK
jgi:alpha-1,2-mannosyltransferase